MSFFLPTIVHQLGYSGKEMNLKPYYNTLTNAHHITSCKRTTIDDTDICRGICLHCFGILLFGQTAEPRKFLYCAPAHSYDRVYFGEYVQTHP